VRKDVLLGLVRLQLKETSTDKLTDNYLYDVMNMAQGDIMRRKWCNEKSFTITLIPNTSTYSIAAQETFLIRQIFPSWRGKIDYIQNSHWEGYKDATGSYPLYATIFGRTLHLAPTPTTTDTITIWSYQTDVLVPIDATHDPETPVYLDNALVLGTCANLDPNFIVLYEDALNKAMDPTIKSTAPKVRASSF
jgi:hypothetical protein